MIYILLYKRGMCVIEDQGPVARDLRMMQEIPGLETSASLCSAFTRLGRIYILSTLRFREFTLPESPPWNFPTPSLRSVLEGTESQYIPQAAFG
jgi:hypothetical protein